jgi:hypothetical protein
MPASPPTKYTPELLQKAKAYVDGVWELDGDKVPTIEGLALHICISRDTLYAWDGAEGKDEISDILSVLRGIQAKKLINNGLSGDYNATITKMMLSKHGYVEVNKQDINNRYVDEDGKDLHKADKSLLEKLGIDV